MAAVACDSTPVELPQATNLVVPATELALFVGEETTVSAQVVDQDGNALPGAQVSWFSSAPSVAAVFEDGFVEAVSAGTANLVATYGSLSAAIAVTVTQETRELVQSVEFLEESGSHDVSEGSVALGTRAFDGYGEQFNCFSFEDQPITVTSSDESVADFGFIDGCQISVFLNAPGQTTITLNVNGASDTYELTVTSDDDFASFIDGLPTDAAAGDTVSIGVQALSETGAPIAGQTINFDVEIGALSATGVPTGADGIATVEWYIPTDLRDFGTSLRTIGFAAQLPSGSTVSGFHLIAVDTDTATTLKLFREVDGDYIAFTADTLTFDTNVTERILVASYDQFGNLVETNGSFASAPVNVITGTGDATVSEGELSSSSPWADVQSATEQTVTLTATVTTAEGGTLEAEVVLVFLDPAP